MSNKNRKCFTCGNKYSYCPTCEKDQGKELWYGMFHEENCMLIFQILTEVTFNRKTKAEAKILLSSLDLSNLESFEENVKAQIKDIFTEELVQPQNENPATETNDAEPKIQIEEKVTTNNYNTKKSKR